jgi:hypothetical protein
MASRAAICLSLKVCGACVIFSSQKASRPKAAAKINNVAMIIRAFQTACRHNNKIMHLHGFCCIQGRLKPIQTALPIPAYQNKFWLGYGYPILAAALENGFCKPVPSQLGYLFEWV